MMRLQRRLDGLYPRACIQGGGSTHPKTQGFQNFQILNSRVKNIKKLVCCSYSALRRLFTWTRATMTEVRMHIHPNRIGDIRDMISHLKLEI